jgi:hypothetical protein
LAFIVTMGALCWAAETKAPVQKPLPFVVVTKTDGTQMRGQITASDPDQVTVKPAPKAGEKTAGEDVVVTWKEIKAISNGLTQKKALEQWKTEHAADLCEKCGGNRVVTCATCKGTGHDPKSSAACKTCNGAMEVKCKAAKCKEGKIACPQPCLKLTEGRWVKKDDGKRWRDLPKGRDGSWMAVSDSHLGQLIVRTKEGKYELGEMCKTCMGKGELACPECHGTSKVPCATCKGDKSAADCADCEEGAKACEGCGGTGLKKA